MMTKPIIVETDRVFVPYKFVDGGMWISLTNPDTRQIFTFIDQDTNEIWHFDIQKLKNIISKNSSNYSIINMAVLTEQVTYIIKYNGIEEEHIDSISEDIANIPGIILHFNDYTDIILDGNHRYIKRWKLGLEYMEFWVCSEDQIKPVLLDIPKDFGKTLV